MHNFPFDVVGFDLDGTLLDTSQDLGVALNHALSLAGRPQIRLRDVGNYVGAGTRIMLTRALESSGPLPPEAEIDALTTELIDYYETHIAVHSRLFPGGEAMLDALQQRGVTLALVTNKLERLALRLLDELALSPRFATIIGGDTLGPGRAKPAPDLLHLMVERTGAKRPAYVGDTSFDTRAARAAAIPCVAVTFGYGDVPAQDLNADALIDHFDHLVPTLNQLHQPPLDHS
jgi:phosphoglycolate phosphatase